VFQVGCSFEVKTQNVNEHMHANPPIEAKTSHDNLDFIGGFKCHDLLQFCIQFWLEQVILARASNLTNMVRCILQGQKLLFKSFTQTAIH